MSTLGALHFFTALLALTTGGMVLSLRKGSRIHRRTGWTYAASMIFVNGSALAIYRLTGTFGPFHVAALISLATLLAGVIPARRRLPADRWLDRHYYFMTWSYVGLLAAAIAESATRLPAVQAIAGGPTLAFWLTVAIASAGVLALGGWMIRSAAERTLRPFRQPVPATHVSGERRT